MHRAFLPDLPLPAQMAQVLVAEGAGEESTVPVLQRAGFTGAQLAAHLSEAVRLADAATRKVLQPDPAFVARHRALVGLVDNLLHEAS